MKKKMTYKDVLEVLRTHQYKAPNNWAIIADQLDLGHELDNLPTHHAPNHLWGGIEKQLDDLNPEIETPINYKVRYRFAGLIILLLLSVIAYLVIEKIPAESEFEYRSETEQVATTTVTDDRMEIDLDPNLTEVYQYIQANEFIFTAEELEQFEQHLEELKSAIQAIQEMKANYGNDESVNKLMARIARDKAKLLKEMVSATS